MHIWFCACEKEGKKNERIKKDEICYLFLKILLWVLCVLNYFLNNAI